MHGGFSSLLGQLYDTIVPVFCGTDQFAANQLGLTEWQFASAKAALFLIFLLPVIWAWYRSWHRLRANGFNKRFWRVGLWFLISITAIQIAEILIVPVSGGVVQCPYDTVAIVAITLLFLYGLYCFHLGAQNKGSFSRFLALIVWPLLWEGAVNSREIGASGAKLLVRALETVSVAISHVYALVHA